MSRLIKFLAIPALAIALLAVSAPSKAEAGGFGFGGVRVGVGLGHHVNFRSYHRPRIIRHHPVAHGIHVGHRAYYHDTTHLDYHPPTIIRHHGHYDVVPGHYDVHRTGHWHH